MKTTQELVQKTQAEHPTWGRIRIAKHLGLSPATVQYHMKPVYPSWQEKQEQKPVTHDPGGISVQPPLLHPSDLVSMAGRLLAKGPMTPKCLSESLGIPIPHVEEVLQNLSETHNVVIAGGTVYLDKPPFGRLTLDILGEEWHHFGLVGDTHLACQEERLDALHLH